MIYKPGFLLFYKPAVNIKGAIEGVHFRQPSLNPVGEW